MLGRGYNFSAGPAALPEPVLQEAQQELLNWRQCGASVLEMGHRSKAIEDLMAETELLFKEVLSIPDDFHVLMVASTARAHFGMVPMSFISANQCADYLITGIWSKMAFEEASKLSRAQCLASGEAEKFTKLPDFNSAEIVSHSPYLYYTSNETINGIQFHQVPESNGVPLVCDMTSSILSEPIDFKKYGLIFAGAQKNIANAGMTLVIVSESFLNSILQDKNIPTMMDYRTYSQSHSLYATPPVFNCYLAHKMLQWVQGQGGIEAMQTINREKADSLYTFIDNSKLYQSRVQSDCRSVMNICFQLKDESLDPLFIKMSEEQGLLALKGHRAVGGMRASIYNAMPLDGVQALIKFMKEFERQNG